MTTWGMTIDLARCAGCRACVADCKQKNATPPGVFWKRLEVTEIGEYPDARRVYLPVQCMHCDDPPCGTVCPTGATATRDDGIVTVDAEVCIGCEACVLACPYDARTVYPSIEGYYGEQLTPYEAERYRPDLAGTATKCDLCADRIDGGIADGLVPGEDRDATPTCVNTCPADAIQFGDLDDPNDGLRRAISSPRAIQLSPELGTDPHVYYLQPE